MKSHESEFGRAHSGIRSNAARSVAGFTLIELMIVVAVVAVLAAIALPSYNESVRKGRRGQAKADLVELSQSMERFHTVGNTYGTDDSNPLAFAQSPRTGRAFYTIAISNRDDNTYTLTATPAADTSQVKDKCGELAVDQSGAKTPTTEGCWQ